MIALKPCSALNKYFELYLLLGWNFTHPWLLLSMTYFNSIIQFNKNLYTDFYFYFYSPYKSELKVPWQEQKAGNRQWQDAQVRRVRRTTKRTVAARLDPRNVEGGALRAATGLQTGRGTAQWHRAQCTERPANENPLWGQVLPVISHYESFWKSSVMTSQVGMAT